MSNELKNHVLSENQRLHKNFWHYETKTILIKTGGHLLLILDFEIKKKQKTSTVLSLQLTFEVNFQSVQNILKICSFFHASESLLSRYMSKACD